MENEIEELANLLCQYAVSGGLEHAPKDWQATYRKRAKDLLQAGYRRTNQLVALDEKDLAIFLHESISDHSEWVWLSMKEKAKWLSMSNAICFKFGLPQKSVEEIEKTMRHNFDMSLAVCVDSQFTDVAQAVHRLVYGGE